MNTIPESILEFWFGGDLGTRVGVAARSRIWFQGDAAFDAALIARFDGFPPRAARGEFDSWLHAARTNLALVLVLDQFPRNLYRGTAQCFQYDPRACEVAVMALERGYDSELTPLEATFLYLPLEHAEDISTQDRCVSLFRRLLDRAAVGLRPQFENFLAFAIRHREVIDRFGRFPHRNAALGRPTTNNERSFLESGGDTFGGATARPDRKP